MSQGFDHWVHHRDRKSGKIARVANYARLCIAGVTYYKRDGKWFDGAGEEIAEPQAVKAHNEAAIARKQANAPVDMQTRSPLAQAEVARQANTAALKV